jgi:transglutaminase-like putative cysteine protease
VKHGTGPAVERISVSAARAQQPGITMGRGLRMTRRSRFEKGTRIILPLFLDLVICTIVHGQESWDATYVNGSKIGYTHTYVEKVKNRGKDYMRVRIDMELSLKRDKDVSIVKMMYGTIETLDGEVLRLDTRTLTGEANEIRTHGDVIKGAMILKLDGNGEHQDMKIPWGPEVRGPYAPEQSMARKPMNDHEKRDLRMFIPELNKIADITLSAGPVESVILGDGSKRALLRVEQTTQVDGKPRTEFNNTMWADSTGQILKAEQQTLGKLVTFRTTKEGALAPSGPIQFDLISGTVIKTPRLIPNSEKTRHVKYRLTFSGGDISETIPSDARQTVQPEKDHDLAILIVKSAGPLDGQPGPAEVDAQYLKPNVLITSQDSRVRSLAQRATRGVVDPWEKAQRINHWVIQNIRDKDFGVGFAAASEVARNLRGDCSEHAVLMAAMCRASGIPARVVVGLVYVERHQGFGYHMWDEVYINQRWVAIDPSWDQTTVDAAHIKLSESSLEGVAPFEAFLPIMKIAGKLQIEPIELR